MLSRTGRLAPVLIAVAAITLSSIFLIFWLGLRVTRANAALILNLEVIAELRSVSFSIKDAEANQRGYLLTGDAQYLTPFTTATVRVREGIEKLGRWAETGEVDHGLADAIASRATARLDLLDEGAQLRRDRGLDTALAVVQSDAGKALSAELGRLLGELEALQRQELLDTRKERDWYHGLRLVAAAAVGLAEALLLVWAFRRIRREIARAELQTQLLGVTIAGIGEGVAITDARGRIVSLNREAERLTGWSDAEARGRAAAEVFRMADEETERPLECPVDEALRLNAACRVEGALLIARHGEQWPIDGGAAPIAQHGDPIEGTALVFRDVAEQRRAEFLRRYELLAAHTRDIILFMAREDGRILEANEAASAYGYTRKELLSLSIHDLRAAEDAGRTAAQMAEADDKGTLFETVHRRKDGSTFPVEVSSRGATIAGRRTLISVIRDVTERKQADEALRESEARLQAVIANLAEGLIVVDPGGTLLHWNRAALDMHGYAEHEDDLRSLARIAPDYDLSTPDGHPVPFEQWPVSRILRGESFRDYELRIRHKPRNWERIFSYSGVLTRDSRGNSAMGLLTIRDVTDARRAEQALRQSEERFRAIFDNAGVGMLEVDTNDRFIAVNDRVCQILGYTPQDLLGMTVHELTAPEDRALSDRINADLHGGLCDRVEYEKRYLKRDGAPLWVHVTVSAICDAEGKWLRSIATVEDIAERKSAEENLRATRAAAEEANRAKDRFLAVLSHELRTPLTPVLAAVSKLQKLARWGDDARSTLEMIQRNVILEARLIDDLLDLTRIARGKVELDRRPVDLDVILQRAVEVCMPDMEARKIEFGVDAPDGPYPVEADAARLQQVFWNLLRNAVKFTAPGGCIGIRCRRDGEGHVVAAVNDSGEGIAPEFLPRLFDAFEQGEQSTTRRFGGLGLGLAISKSLVELHGGTIEAHSAGKGRGASFRVRLPLLPAKAESALEAAGGGDGRTALAPVSPSLRILYVEDHGDTAELMRDLLESEGHRVETAGDVATALDLAARHAFDVLVSDLGLPDGSGIDLMRHLRERGNTLPGVALSGYGQEQDIRETREAGFAAHVSKPVGIDRLLEVIAQVANRGN